VFPSTFEDIENTFLAPYAVKSSQSKGRAFSEPPSPNRTCFQRDRDRIIHSKAFRRLKHKTQVFIATESDHYRSRMTHTLEVAQISRHLARALRLNEDLAECIALAHDLGHTPFGHSGERELNLLMKDFGGFEHNTQSLRILDVLEDKYPMFPGLNVSFEIREGLKKHSTPWDHPPDTEETSFLTLEAQVVNLADEIAYNNHDLDDGLSAKILHELELEEHVSLWREAKSAIKAQYDGVPDHHLKTLINSYLISTQIQDVLATTTANIQELGLQSLDQIQHIQKPIVTFGKDMKIRNHELRRYLFKEFYSHLTVYRMNKKGQHIIKALFEAFSNDTKLLPFHHQDRLKTEEKHRVVADYIAGMTDVFAQKEYQTLF
jgi:dGTPase